MRADRTDSTYAIRMAHADDALALADLSAQLGYPATAADIAARLARVGGDVHAGAVFVAMNTHGKVVGWTHVAARRNLEEESFAELAGLVVDAASRGSGLGKALLLAAENWARTQGFARLRVRSNVLRERAHRFYLREGYIQTKRQVVFDKALS